MELNPNLIAFVYSILVRQELGFEQINLVIEGKNVPADFRDDNMLMAKAFEDLEYITDMDKDLETLSSDSYVDAWNAAYSIALKQNLFPWEFECYWSKEAFVDEITTIESLKFFGTDNGYCKGEYELMHKLSVGETMQSVDYGHYHTIKRLK